MHPRFSAALYLAMCAIMLTFGAISLRAQTKSTVSRKFDFGPGALQQGYLRVTEQSVYSPETGYGFEPGAQITCLDRPGKNDLRSDFCSSEQPFYFSVKLPEGNYNVTVTLGDAAGESLTTIKAELRRLMVEKVDTKNGRFKSITFTVNIRTPQIAGDGEVRLKDREKTTETWAWDEKLTLEFSNRRPAISAIEITDARVPTLYLLGDSTVADQPREPYNSWGQMLTRFFGPGVAIANHAESGESLRSSLAAKRLDKVLSTIQPGDYLFIQYGHNDEKEKGEGVGAFTTYKSDLKKFVTEARARKAIPVLITPVQRRTFDLDHRITNSHGDYPEAVRQVAKEEKVPLIDLNVMSKTLYEAWGTEPSKRAFAPNDNTHHNNYGSYELAKCIVEGIRTNKLDIARYLVKDLPRFDPSRPDLFESVKIPPSPLQSDGKPAGN
jgi:lysophospholipase L1-like esterase